MRRTLLLATFASLVTLPACTRPDATAAAATKSEPAPSAASVPASTASSAPSAESAACPPFKAELPEVAMVGEDAPIPDIEDGDGLASFHARLGELARGTSKDHVRIAVYGDSNGTRDFMTGEMRRVLQLQYGDAGHGFVALARPWNWYLHKYVKHDHWAPGWEPFTVTTKPSVDVYGQKDVIGYYGHALIAAQSEQGSAVTWVSTVDAASPIGSKMSSADVYYLKKPGGGRFDVRVDGKVVTNVDTDAKEVGAGFYKADMPDGPHKVEFVATTPRKVRLFGVAIEREPIGIQVDGLGVGSLNCLTMLRDHPPINQATLARRKYDLVVFHIGSNTFTAKEVAPCMKEVIARHRAALPNASFLIMTPPDFVGGRNPPSSTPWIREVAIEQRVIAKDNKAAFFGFRDAMGGEGSMVKFQGKDLSGDWVHFNDKGGAYMGGRVVYTLLKDFRRWAEKNPVAGCAK
jgi:hypothetical protein